ncbi:hypothetical protein BD413DRAFT_496503 [Trametes elegans]|nr:hypothetical protein BD413DRAFT_496503 [Trametes elegans]
MRLMCVQIPRDRAEYFDVASFAVFRSFRPLSPPFHPIHLTTSSHHILDSNPPFLSTMNTSGGLLDEKSSYESLPLGSVTLPVLATPPFQLPASQHAIHGLQASGLDGAAAGQCSHRSAGEYVFSLCTTHVPYSCSSYHYSMLRLCLETRAMHDTPYNVRVAREKRRRGEKLTLSEEALLDGVALSEVTTQNPLPSLSSWDEIVLEDDVSRSSDSLPGEEEESSTSYARSYSSLDLAPAGSPQVLSDPLTDSDSESSWASSSYSSDPSDYGSEIGLSFPIFLILVALVAYSPCSTLVTAPPISHLIFDTPDTHSQLSSPSEQTPARPITLARTQSASPSRMEMNPDKIDDNGDEYDAEYEGYDESDDEEDYETADDDDDSDYVPST